MPGPLYTLYRRKERSASTLALLQPSQKYLLTVVVLLSIKDVNFQSPRSHYPNARREITSLDAPTVRLETDCLTVRSSDTLSMPARDSLELPSPEWLLVIQSIVPHGKQSSEKSFRGIRAACFIQLLWPPPIRLVRQSLIWDQSAKECGVEIAGGVCVVEHSSKVSGGAL